MFEFLELENNEHKHQISYQEVIKEIPDNQFLAMSDFKIINPSASVLKCISGRILEKYFIVPLFILPPGNKPLLPRHLNGEFWGSMQGKKNMTIYVAMTNPFNLQALNIIRSVTGYSVISIPVSKETVNNFFATEFKQIISGKLPEQEKISVTKKTFIFLKDNIFYIITFLLIIIGLLSVKLLIEG